MPEDEEKIEETKSRRFLPLYDFRSKYERTPSVFLIWQRIMGASKEQMNLVCIHSSEALAVRRVASLNSARFWNKADLNLPSVYSYEAVPIDHLFASIEMGYDDELDKIITQVTSAELCYHLNEHRYEHMLRYATTAKARIEELEKLLEEKSKE